MEQCLLAMKDMRDSNGRGKVYGFITNGKSWQMLGYDGASFQMTEEMVVLFHTMDGDKERWIRDYSVLVDCMYAALNSGLRMTVPKAEQRLSLTMEAISVDIMLANAKHSLERGFVLKTKEMVYYHILQYLQLEGRQIQISTKPMLVTWCCTSSVR